MTQRRRSVGDARIKWIGAMGGRSLVARIGTAGVASLHGLRCDFVRRGRMSVATNVRLGSHPGRHMGFDAPMDVKRLRAAFRVGP